MAKDFYSILGVTRSSSQDEIKQAYRKLSRELHPDKHPSTGSGQVKKDAEAKFKEVNEAYGVLSDPKKKQAYDQFGSTNGSPFGGGGGQGFGGFGGAGGFDSSQFQGGDLGDLFESFFGGNRGASGRRRNDAGRNAEVEITISLLQAVTGMDQTITINAHVTCGDCKGSGSAEGAKLINCSECGGTGTVQRITNSLFGQIRQSVLCSLCNGSGKLPEKPCKKCRGEGRVMDKKTVTVHVPAGIDHGQTLRVTGEGEAGERGGKSGDLLVRIRVEPDRRFERDGDDVRSSLSLSALDAILGAEVNIDTVHGTVKMTIPAGTQPNQILRVKHKGMPVVNSSRVGDHYVTIDLVVPTKLSRDERRLFEELRKVK